LGNSQEVSEILALALADRHIRARACTPRPGRPIAVVCSAMTERARIVARFLDGRLLKGYTRNFDPRKSVFEVFEWGFDDRVEPVHVKVRELKTLFFVRSFNGNSTYNERKDFDGPFTGKRLSLEFTDGELMVGTTFGYDAERQGFFFFPADAASNNEKVFVNLAAVKRIVNLPRGARVTEAAAP
jgi:hypothetical protein